MTATEKQSKLAALESPAAEDLYRCVHCGLCLPSCPTYVETGLETESPRGRLALMKAVKEGRLALTDRVVGHMELCVQCRACEAICPSGVPFGRAMEATRAQIQASRRPPFGERFARWLAFRVMLPHPRLLQALFWGLRLYQRLGLQWLVREFRVLRPLPALERMEQQAPRLGAFFKAPASGVIPAEGQRHHRVGMLAGCVMPLAYGRVNEATARVLARNGCEVALPRGQGCCGALHTHSGEREIARRLARKNIDAFLAAGVEAIVVNSAGCAATMKEYGDLLRDDPQYRDKAVQFGALVKDIHEYLAALPLKPPSRGVKARVTYQDSCHLAHAQRIKDAPRAVMRAIPGLALVEMEGSDMCCGAGGIYTITHRQLSRQILDHKLEHALAVQPEIIATANPGCMLQLEMGLRLAGARTRVAHVIELLDEAYGAGGP